MDLSVAALLGRPSPWARVAARPTVGQLAGLLQEVAGRPETWWRLARFDAVPVPVPAGRGVWLTAWPAGHHLSAEVADAEVLTVVAGELTELTIGPCGVAERTLRANRVQIRGASSGSDVLRELHNAGPAYAISLHTSGR
jgi:hypothetical protein